MNLFVLFVSTSVFLRIRVKSQPLRPPIDLRSREQPSPFSLEFVSLDTRTHDVPSSEPAARATSKTRYLSKTNDGLDDDSGSSPPPCGSSWECAAIKGLWLSRVMNYVMTLYYNESCDKFKDIAYLE